jgi:hypothetical protein
MKAWFKPIILISLILVCAINSDAKRVKSPYQDFVIVKDKIYVLTGGGYLKIYNTDHGKLIGKYVSPEAINLICKDRIGNLVVVLNNDEIKRIKSDGNWEKLGSYHGNIFSIAFDSRNICFLVTNRGYIIAQQRKPTCRLTNFLIRNGAVLARATAGKPIPLCMMIA